MFDLVKPMPFGLNRRNWPFYAVGFMLLVVAVFWADVSASRAAQAWPTPVVEFFHAITDIGKSDWILVPSLLICLACGALVLAVPEWTPKRAFLQLFRLFGFVFVGVGLPGLVGNLIKRAVGRGRPELLDSIGPLGFQNFLNDYTFQSFPSGHATTSFALAYVIGFLSPRWFPGALVVAIAVSISRVPVGAHFPTDVLGGIVVGTLGAYAVRNIFASRRWVFERNAEGNIVARRWSAIHRLMRQRKG